MKSHSKSKIAKLNTQLKWISVSFGGWNPQSFKIYLPLKDFFVSNVKSDASKIIKLPETRCSIH